MFLEIAKCEQTIEVLMRIGALGGTKFHKFIAAHPLLDCNIKFKDMQIESLS